MRVTRKSLTEAELDALVVRALSRLPSHAPSRGFDARVMARVQLPRPRPVVLYQRARAWVSQPRRALALAGAYVVFASVALVFTVPWLLENIPAFQFATQWAVQSAGSFLRETSLGVASWWMSSGLADAARVVPRSGPRLWLALGSLTAVYAGSAVGLHLLLRAPRVTHATQLSA